MWLSYHRHERMPDLASSAAYGHGSARRSRAKKPGELNLILPDSDSASGTPHAAFDGAVRAYLASANGKLEGVVPEMVPAETGPRSAMQAR